MKTPLSYAALAAAIILSILPNAFAQGNLAPPGAPMPTMKTLDQVEARTPLAQPISPSTLPININASGSYYLTGNITAPAGYTGSGVAILVDNVTLDLNGFTLTGVSGSGSGVLITGGKLNILIKNGTIRNWGGNAINGLGNPKVRVSHVRASSNAAVTGAIAIDVNGEVSDCIADGNGGNGIFATDNCLIQNCRAIANTGTANGISVGNNCVVRDCVVASNTGAGIITSTGCNVAHCTATGNGGGISVGADSTVTNCTASKHTTGAGIAANNSMVTNCTANENKDGIAGGTYSRITGCIVVANTDHGITGGDSCHIVGNTCDNNGNTVASTTSGAIYVTGTENGIDGNFMTDNHRGITTDLGSNTITRNFSRSNGANAFPSVAGNDLGPLGTAAAVSSPWANIND